MKKFLYLLILPFLAACGVGQGMNGFDGNQGLAEETLGAAETPERQRGSRGEGREGRGGPRGGADLLFGGPRFYIGAPFMLDNVQYVPAENWNYNETGIAGIMPVDLNGASTTNGERVNTNAMIATSKVLPLPSIVRVTNLENNQSVILRVNNRGPFVNSRIMDVSPAAARRLGMTGQTRVRVEIMPDESRTVRDLSIANQGGPTAVPVAAPAVTVAPMAAAGTEGIVTVAPVAAATITGAIPAGGTGPFTVQAGAYFSQESANGIARQISNIGSAVVNEENGMFKIQFRGLTQEQARHVIQRLRTEHHLAPGLIRNGRWINADSI